MATLIATDGSKREVEVNGLSDLQEAVGGLIEVLGVAPDGRTILCNEEGLLNDLPVNLPVMYAFGYECVGDVLLVNDKEFN